MTLGVEEIQLSDQHELIESAVMREVKGSVYFRFLRNVAFVRIISPRLLLNSVSEMSNRGGLDEYRAKFCIGKCC